MNTFVSLRFGSSAQNMARWCLAALVLAPLLVATSGLDAGAQTTMLSGDDFFQQAKRSISHDKKVCVCLFFVSVLVMPAARNVL